MTNKPVLLVTHEPLEARMAGPAIRAWHLAHELAAVRPVQLATPKVTGIESQHNKVSLIPYNYETGQPLEQLAQDAAVIIVSGYLLRRFPFLRSISKPMVVDIYDPFVLENLEIHAAKPINEQVAIHNSNLDVLLDQLGRGDFFICASESQRDFWLGMLMAAGRINPLTLTDDPTLRRLIDVVSFGLPGEPPEPSAGIVKGRIPGIKESDHLIYWGGGIWDWFDPLTLIRAVARISAKRNDVKLLFAGVQHPSPDVPPMRMCQAAMKLSDSLRLTDRFVFFNDWVPYQQRGAYLLEADIGASLHFDHVETRFSFRTRLLDYLWAGLPMLLTKGDVIGKWVQQHDLGFIVNPQDVDQVHAALIQMLENPRFRDEAADRFKAVRQNLYWSQVTKPLQLFCSNPQISPDHIKSSVPTKSTPLLDRVWAVLRQQGPKQLLRESRSYLAWRLGRNK